MSTEITLNVERLVGGVITITTGRNPAMTRLWWTTPRSGGEMQSRAGGDYSDVAISGTLTQSSVTNIDGHSIIDVVAVEIGNTVTSIGDMAFNGCSALTSVTIPNSVTSIGTYAFWGCILTNVTIPNSVTIIDTYAFSDCSALTSVTIPDSVTSIGSGAFYNCIGLTSIMIPNSVTGIGSSAFEGCSGLTSVTIGNGVTNIGSSAFSGCSGITSMTIPDSVTSIGNMAFYGCITLQEMNFLGKTIDYVSQNSINWGIGFNDSGKTFMVTAYCQDGIVVLNAKSGSSSGGSEGDQRYTYVDYFNGRSEKYDISGQFNQYTIYDIKDAQRIEFGNQISYIDDNVCADSPYLEYVKIPSSVSTISGYAFSGCRNLSEIVIEGQPMIGSYVFYDSPIQTAWMTSFMMWEVAEQASYWGLGFGNSGTHTVVVYCSDGILVLNGDSGSSGSGS